MKNTKQRTKYDAGLLWQIETLARFITKWEENGWKDDIANIQAWEQIYGYVIAGFLTGIITDVEFNALWDELTRWRYSR